ncbi:MAG: CDP-2,3-bis-(O-geranylgeranyl)-sn-glycerol synthase [Methanosphaera sp.]|nr:CDP-2,3-bis-(O-geranylgeranyl)-sn-glycerol synthase [Methanosphaera sp.]
MDIITLVCYSIYFMIPAYLANGSALVFGGGTPMDFGRNAWDGHRLIGDGVTWRGTIGAGLFGMLIGGLLGYLSTFGVCSSYFNMLAANLTFTSNPVFQGLIIGLLLGFGALIGDAIGSFIKRRLNFERGKAVPLLDQLDFVVVALIFASLVVDISLEMIVCILVLSVFFHLGANILAYAIHLKDVWY